MRLEQHCWHVVLQQPVLWLLVLPVNAYLTTSVLDSCCSGADTIKRHTTPREYRNFYQAAMDFGFTLAGVLSTLGRACCPAASGGQ